MNKRENNYAFDIWPFVFSIAYDRVTLYTCSKRQQQKTSSTDNMKRVRVRASERVE